MPSTLHRWVRPRKASDASIGVRRAIRHIILEDPMASTERMALLRAGIWRMRGASDLKLMAGRPSWPYALPPRRLLHLQSTARTPAPERGNRAPSRPFPESAIGVEA